MKANTLAFRFAIDIKPAFGVVLSWLFLGEGLPAFHLTGIGLIALGIYLAMIRRR